MADVRPTLASECAARAQGYQFVAGVDEVGRGSLAGPVVAAAVILPFPACRQAGGEGALWEHLDEARDSKLLTARQREALLPRIQAVAVAIGVGVAPSWEVDSVGIVGATRRAMVRAVRALSPAADYVLTDYVRLPDLDCPHLGIVKGDRTCLSIAAASIVAKVSRDEWMCRLAQMWPGYGLEQHKGYPTVAHERALARLGLSPIHRRSFAPVQAVLRGDAGDLPAASAGQAGGAVAT